MLVLGFFCLNGICRAEPADRRPFYTSNQNPFVRIFGLPPNEGGRLLREQQWELHWIAGAANSSAISSNPEEQVWLDGESYRALLALNYGLNRRLGANVPSTHLAVQARAI